MANTITAKKILGLSAIFILLLLPACRGNTGGGEADFAGSQFVAGQDTTGTLTINLDRSSMPVSGTSGFIATVRNNNGQPVPRARISCDSERGVAILEPSEGFSVSDAFGSISGVIGCEAPGSFQFACWLSGSSRITYVPVRCTGDVPTGFAGFPGAGGGNLGGGVVQHDDGDFRIVDVAVFDEGSAPEGFPAVDTEQGDCEVGTPPNTTMVPEPFFNTLVRISVENNTFATIRFTEVEATILNIGADGEGQPVGVIAEIPGNGGQGNVTALFVGVSNGRKALPGQNTTLANNLGIRNVRFRIRGTNEFGENVTASATIAVNFADLDRCHLL